MYRLGNGTNICGAYDALGVYACAGQRRQQQSNQQSDNRYDDQQFNKRKSTIFHLVPLFYKACERIASRMYPKLAILNVFGAIGVKP